MSEIVVAPFSHSDIRDWPLDRYAELIGLLLARTTEEVVVRVVGSGGQRLRAHEIVRSHPATRVANDCGRLPWDEVTVLLRGAACIISNNSGIGHLGGHLGAPTVCIFGGSHPRAEWRPLGPRVVVVSRVIGCSPCQLDHTTGSPYAKACLREIHPQEVADAALSLMDAAPGSSR